MKQHRKSNATFPLSLLLLVAALGATTTGCASLAEKVATHMVEKDVKALDQEFKVFEHDLGLFRKCLKERGGTCQGSDSTALLGTSEHVASQSVVPASRQSQVLADSVQKLPAGHPARSAYRVLSHPVAAQAAALHDHLRGHDTGTVSGFSVEKGQGAHGGPESTVTMSMGLGHVQDFHKGLLSSLGTGGWDSLHDHCKALLSAHGGASGGTDPEAECRRVSFIRGYLRAYTRGGEFVEVDVQLVGAVEAVNKGAAKITAKIQKDIAPVLKEIKKIEKDIDTEESKLLLVISNDASKVENEITTLIDKAEADVTKRFGKVAATLFKDLTRLATSIDDEASKLAAAANKTLGREEQALLSDLDRIKGKASGLTGAARQTLVKDIRKLVSSLDFLFTEVEKNLEKLETGKTVNADATQVKTKIQKDIAPVLAKVKGLQGDIDADASKLLRELSGDASAVQDQVSALIGRLEADVKKDFDEASSKVSEALKQLTTLVGDKTGELEAAVKRAERDVTSDFEGVEGKAIKLTKAARQALVKDIKKLVSELDRDLNEVATKLESLVTDVMGADQEAVKELNKATKALSNIAKVSNTGFVSRDDSFRARLPTLHVTLDPTVKNMLTANVAGSKKGEWADAQSGQPLTARSDFGHLGVATDTSGVDTGDSIGAEVVRVFLEAVFDAHEGLPALAPVNSSNARPTGLTLPEYSLKLFKSPSGNVDASDVSNMTHINDQVAAKTQALTKKIVAGIGPFSLNNPPIEDFIVEVITTSVRKATAKATWCWYACDLDVDVKDLVKDAKTVGKAEETAIEDRLKDEEKKIEGKLTAEEGKVEGEVTAEEDKIAGKLKAEEDKIAGKVKAEEEKLQGKEKKIEDKLTAEEGKVEGEVTGKEERVEAKLREKKEMIEAKLKADEQKLEGKAREEAEHVKLRLKLTKN